MHKYDEMLIEEFTERITLTEKMLNIPENFNNLNTLYFEIPDIENNNHLCLEIQSNII